MIRRRMSAPSVTSRCESGVTATVGRKAASSEAALISVPPRRIRTPSRECSIPVVSTSPSLPTVRPTICSRDLPCVTTSRNRCDRKDRPEPMMWIASRRLDFPLPFEPTRRLTCGENSTSTLSSIRRCRTSIAATRMTEFSVGRFRAGQPIVPAPSKSHGHHHELTVALPLRLDQAAAGRIREKDVGGIRRQCRQRINEI